MGTNAVMTSSMWWSTLDIKTTYIYWSCTGLLLPNSYIHYIENCEKDTKIRIRKAWAVFSKMKRTWKSKQPKLKLYEAIILSALLYGAELWPLNNMQTKNWKIFTKSSKEACWDHHSNEKVNNEELRRRTGQMKLESILWWRKSRWLGRHELRMEVKKNSKASTKMAN